MLPQLLILDKGWKIKMSDDKEMSYQEAMQKRREKNRNIIFAFKVNKSERELIDKLAIKLERNRSDAVRFAIRRAARELGIRTQI